MYNLDQFYPTLSYWLRDSTSNRQTAVVYPYPFGSSNPENVIFDCDYDFPDLVFLLYDQEPIWSNVSFLNYYGELFKEWESTVVLISGQEYGDNLAAYIKKYNWHFVHFQFQLLVSRDWFRGYSHNPLIKSPATRELKKHFVSFNRLFAENRPHRCRLLADLHQNNLLDKGLISFPKHDPATQQTISEVFPSEHLLKYNPNDLEEILPLTIDDVDHSNLSFEIETQKTQQCFLHIVTETAFDICENYISEKVFKPIVLKQPFVVLGTPGTLETMNSLGFDTFDEYWSERYDVITNHNQRYEQAFEIVKRIASWPMKDCQYLYSVMEETLERNYNHFFSKEVLDTIFLRFYSDLIGLEKKLGVRFEAPLHLDV